MNTLDSLLPELSSALPASLRGVYLDGYVARRRTLMELLVDEAMLGSYVQPGMTQVIPIPRLDYSLQASNPNAILFFLALFPQFIDHSVHGLERGAILVATYAAIVVAIHSVYALGARRTRVWLSSAGGGRLVNRVSGTAFILSGVALAASSPRLPR